MIVDEKIKILTSLIERMNSMSFADINSALPEFRSEGEVILTKIFGENSKHVNKFAEVTFTPSHFYSNTTERIYQEELEAFSNGKHSMLGVLKGALMELDLEKKFPQPSQLSFEEKLDIISTQRNKVFIVHGHDEALKTEVARFVEKLGFEAVILHEQPNEGRTIIEKIEKHSDVGFAIVLYTPCDEGKSKTSETLKDRARQNVVFEHGYFIAKLGRNNVVALHKGTDIELPNDISGVVYIKYENGIWKTEIADEMDASGYEINYKLVR